MEKRENGPFDQGFTLVEIMIVVAIIALLTAIAIPAFLQYRKDGQDSLYLTQIRVMRDAAKAYNLKTGTYPPNVGSGVCPAGMTNYYAKLDWSKDTPIGGRWNWDRNYLGATAAVSVVNPARNTAEMKYLDEVIDDGDLGSGYFQKVVFSAGNERYQYRIE